MRRLRRLVVIGGGLAGSEAAWQASKMGVEVSLIEMRPKKMTQAHRTGLLSELVCSNSFKSESISTGQGLLKVELRMLGTLLMEVASKTRVPAGMALCVDRELFAEAVTEAIERNPLISLERREVTRIERDDITIVAAGPLASEELSNAVRMIVGGENLYFYDAISPIVEADSIDKSKCFRSARYSKGDSTYLNIPLTKELYMEFVKALREAVTVPIRPFEEARFFSACMPVEELARSGDQTLAFGCMKPVGLVDSATGEIPYAVVQLRPENRQETLYGIVGFQTRLKYGEQERVFRMLPGLENARFSRLGSVHRNTFINSPSTLKPTLEHKEIDNIFFAGQITGAEGYVAAIATGALAGINAARKALGLECVVPPAETVIGGLVKYLSQADPSGFQPMNPSMGLLSPLKHRVHGRRTRALLLAERAVKSMRKWIEENEICKSVIQ